MDDDNDDEIDRNHAPHFFYIPYHIDMVWDGYAFEFPVYPHWVEGG